MCEEKAAMSVGPSAVIHASALLVGPMAVIVRGASGAGKSSLVLDLIETLSAEGRFAMLIGDDRVAVEAVNQRLIVRAAPTIAGLIERRGHGIARLEFEPAGIVGLVVDLVTGEPTRMPEMADQSTDLCGITLRRMQIAGFGEPRTRLVLAAIDAAHAGTNAPTATLPAP
jgi:serine kinase of HPr protein (carbohydrate metabolism regulator)